MQCTVHPSAPKPRETARTSSSMGRQGKLDGFHTVGGTGQGSYHEFSKSFLSAVNVFFWPKLSRAIAEACRRQLANSGGDAEAVDFFTIADFGCSCAASTVESTQLIANCVNDQVCAGRASDAAHSPPSELHIQAFFNDLPSNDFNTLFALLSSPQGSTAQLGFHFIPCGLPGSFYSRFFPPRSLRIALSTLALHNLSKVPDAVQNPNSPAWNRNGVWIFEGCSIETAMAYKEQFFDDFTCFLQQRSQELVPGGLLFCVLIAAKPPVDKTLPHRAENPKIKEHIQTAWRQLISEGLLDQRSLDEFNLPNFLPTLDEVKEVVCGSAMGEKFEVLEMECEEVEKAPKHVWMESAAADAEAWGRACETMVRNFSGSLIRLHLGDAKFELLMERVRLVAAATDENLQCSYMMDVIVLSLMRR